MKWHRLHTRRQSDDLTPRRSHHQNWELNGQWWGLMTLWGSQKSLGIVLVGGTLLELQGADVICFVKLTFTRAQVHRLEQ